MDDSKHIEKLKGRENWELWKFQATIILQAKGAFTVATGKYKKPTVTKPEEVEEETEWLKKDAEAKKLIITTVERATLVHIMDCSTSADMWQKLTTIYGSDGTDKKCTLMREFFAAQYQRGTPIMTHVSQLQNIFNKLKVIDAKVEDEMLISKILCTLPGSMNAFITAWEMLEKEKQTLTNLMSRLMAEETRMKGNVKDEGAVAFGAKEIRCYRCDKPGHVKRTCKAKIKCTNEGCGKMGHLAKNCRLTKGKVGGQDPCIHCKRTNHKSDDCFFKNKNGQGTSGQQQGRVKPVTYFANDDISGDEWVIDSGSTSHITNNLELLENVQEIESEIGVAKKGNSLKTTKVGEVNAEKCSLKEVLYSKDLAKNLMSVNAIVSNDGVVTFSKEGVKVTQNGNVVLQGIRNENGLFTINLQGTIDKNHNLFLAKKNSTALEWHKKLGHLSEGNMIRLLSMSEGMTFTKTEVSEALKNCEICILAKQTRTPLENKREKATRVIQLINSDVSGPVEEPTWDGKRYFVSFQDDFSGFTQTYLMSQKSEVTELFIEYVASVEAKFGTKVSQLRCDQGGEYVAGKLKDFCKRKGIFIDYAPVKRPEMNGRSERLNRSLYNVGRSLIFESGMSKSMWGEAIYVATYLLNRRPKAGQTKTPYELWFNKKPNLNYLKIFGTVAYAKKMGRCKKFDERSEKLIFIGYSPNGYRLWNEKEKKIICSRDVIFQKPESLTTTSEKPAAIKQYAVLDDLEELAKEREEKKEENGENALGQDESSDSEKEDSDVLALNDSLEIAAVSDVDDSDVTLTGDTEEGSEWVPSGDETENDTLAENLVLIEGERRYPERERAPVQRYPDHASFAFAYNAELIEPNTYAEAMGSIDSELWQKAACAEIQNYERNKTWILTDLPKGKRAIKGKWVLKIKRKADGAIDKYKARLVARGFTQKEGIDYKETFSPVVRHCTIRFLFALAAKLGLKIDHWDVDSAFLNGNLQEEVYLEQPEGFIKKGQEKKVYLLKKAIYGLKQGANVWYKDIDNTLMSLGFEKARNEACVYFKISPNFFSIIALYVDDLVFLYSSEQVKAEVKKALFSKYSMKDLGPINYCLGMRIQRDEKTGIISIDQQQYIKELLKRFNMEDSRAKDTPMEIKSKIYNLSEAKSKVLSSVPYQNLIGALMYLAVSTRPDIAFSLSYLSQFNKYPTEQHWIAAKRVLRYLKGTQDRKLVYNPEKGQRYQIEGYTDADWGGDSLDRRSYTGFTFFFSGGPISWEARKQRTVALSSTESEYLGLSESAKEALFLSNLHNQIFKKSIHVKIYNDNLSAQKLIKNPTSHSRTKHIDIRHHFIRDVVKSGRISIEYLSTDKMIADVLTKALSKPKHEFCTRNLLM